MSIKQFSDLLLDSSIALVSYNGFGKLKCFTDFANVTMMVKVDIEAGDEAWIGEASKAILEEIDQTIESGSSLCYDPTTKLVVGVKHELFHTSDRYEIPDFHVGDSIAYIKFSTTEWKAINKFGAIAKEKVEIQITGNLLTLTTIARDGIIAMQILVLDSILPNPVEFTIPSRALFDFDAEPVSVEVGKEKVMIQAKDWSFIWAIDPGEHPSYLGLIPEGQIEIQVPTKDLKSLIGKKDKIRISISKKKSSAQLRSTKIAKDTGKATVIKVEIKSPFDTDAPSQTVVEVAAEAIESAIKLIGTAKLITLAIPAGGLLQYVALSAAAIRCLVPTVINLKKSLTKKEILSPEPVVLNSETTTIEISEGEEVTMTVSAVEQLNLPSGIGLDPKTLGEAIDRLKVETESAKDAIAQIPIRSGIEVEDAVRVIEETLLSEAQTALSTERGSMFSKEDIKKITNAIVRAIARIEAIRLDLQTWELQVTFRN